MEECATLHNGHIHSLEMNIVIAKLFEFFFFIRMIKPKIFHHKAICSVLALLVSSLAANGKWKHLACVHLLLGVV